MRIIGLLVAAIAALFLGMPQPGMTAEKRYFAYETYRALIALCPDVNNARLQGLQPAALDLWRNGKLRMPEETHVFHGDFNRDGRPDIAIAITNKTSDYLLIAEQTTRGLKRSGLVKIKDSVSAWNGRALVTSSGFVVWDGKQYRLEQGALANYCYQYDPAAFMGVMIKLTYVGPQTESYPGLLISSYYRWPNLAEFASHRRAGVHYGNDDIPVMWHITIAPERLHKLTLVLNRLKFTPQAEDRTGKEGAAQHSLAILDTSSAIRPNFYEVFLVGSETVSLLKAFAHELEGDNKAAAEVLREYKRMFGS